VRFLADMGGDVRVVEWLRDQGHDAIHLREEGLQRAPDDRVFEKAIAEARVILTFDLDFADVIALARGRSPSIILFRLGNPRLSQVKDRLASVLATSAAELDRGAVVVVERARHRVRHLPIGSD
jgi:predicted nuclease of predicted toxin-antitoxin system